MSDDFYIGYEPAMPERLAPRIRRVTAGLMGVAIAVSLGLAVAQGRFASGVFEFGHERIVEGRLTERPYPVLVTSDGVPYFLVGPGKRGAAAIADGFAGRLVRAHGTLIERDGSRMLQVSRGSIVDVPGAAVVAAAPLEARDVEVLDGEIVDSKCHLGVMKPGEGPLHRDCAVRCLLGGAPPMLVTTAAGRPRRLILIGEDGGPLHADLEPWAARPIRLRGRVFGRGGERYLAVDWSTASVR